MGTITNFRNGANILLTQEELQQFSQQWSESLPTLSTEAAPFYTLMKFDGEQNTGEVFAYPGIQLDFGVELLCVTLFPTAEIAKESEAILRETNPEWRVVGLNESFLDLLLTLVRHQQLKLTISLSPNESVVWATTKVPALADAIKEQGFRPEMLDVEDAGEESAQ